LFFISGLVFAGRSAQANFACPKPEGGACGQCEPQLQAQMDQLSADADAGKFSSVEEFLNAIPPVMRDNEALIGNSLSTQPGTVVIDPLTSKPKVRPRVVMKSPNSEVWITYNTDPHAKNYNTVEITRWNGKKPGWEYSQFPPVHDHDVAKDCKLCHREELRPNFDSYQTWAGFLPPRDDVLERTANGEPDPSSSLWLSFMDEVIQAKKTGGSTRLSGIKIPYPGDEPDDVKLQHIRDTIRLGPDVQTANATNADTSVLHGYRIEHLPTVASGELTNTSGKTFLNAGFGHVAFDQMLNLQMCQVGTNLERDKNYPKFKYALAAIVNGCTPNRRLLDDLPDFQKQIANQYFNNSNSTKKKSLQTTSETTLDRVFADTALNESQLDIQKQKRETQYLTQLGVPSAETYGRKLVSVPDTATEEISRVRYLLEPFGIRVGDWSMSFGNDLSKQSYTFADQFEILHQQALFGRVEQEYNNSHTGESYCDWLKAESKQALSSAPTQAPIVKQDLTANQILGSCRKVSTTSLRGDAFGKVSSHMALVASANSKVLRREAQGILNQCVSCHSSSSVVDENVDSGQTNVFTAGPPEKLKSWLETVSSSDKKRTWFDRVVAATSYAKSIKMPPTHPLSDESRQILLAYLASVVMSDDGTGDGYACEEFSDTSDKPNQSFGISDPKLKKSGYAK